MWFAGSALLIYSKTMVNWGPFLHVSKYMLSHRCSPLCHRCPIIKQRGQLHVVTCLDLLKKQQNPAVFRLNTRCGKTRSVFCPIGSGEQKWPCILTPGKSQGMHSWPRAGHTFLRLQLQPVFSNQPHWQAVADGQNAYVWKELYSAKS